MMRLLILCCSLVILAAACKTSGPSLFNKRSFHDEYAKKLEDAGLKNTVMGGHWLRAADASLSNPVNINLPYKEMGYFSAESPNAVGLRFTARRGEKLTISINKKPAVAFTIYLELWKDADASNSKRRLIEALDTTKSSFTYEVDANSTFILRLQPELLTSGEYTISIQNSPSLAYPVNNPKANIISVWGVDRDGGTRRHEGVDISSARGVHAVAAAHGKITKVNSNNLGGKAVWLRPFGKDYTLYYAHLDEQHVREGQEVKQGETVGLVGSTGNAKSPHLHFGIYTSGGAIDPQPFVDRNIKSLPNLVANTNHIGKTIRIDAATKVFLSPDAKSQSIFSLEKNTPVHIQSAYASWYKIKLPDGAVGFIASDKTQQLNSYRKINFNKETALLDAPSIEAARKIIVPKGEQIDVLGSYNKFTLVQYKNTVGWISI
jgi:murein DD-endopeptidase MepM/ murein hydrolase activator NlpD